MMLFFVGESISVDLLRTPNVEKDTITAVTLSFDPVRIACSKVQSTDEATT